MKIYLASRFDHRFYMREYVKGRIEELGHEVTSHWIHRSDLPDGLTERERSIERVILASEDMFDIIESDAIICFTEDGSKYTRGGRHVELGIALALKKITILVGPEENVFYSLVDMSYTGLYEFRAHMQAAFQKAEKIYEDKRFAMAEMRKAANPVDYKLRY